MSLDLQKLNALIALEENSGRKIIFVDASSLKDTGCFRKFYWTSIKGYKPKTENLVYDIKIEYGSAYHKFLENWYKGRPIQDCVESAATYYDKILSHSSIRLDNEYEFRTMAHLLNSIRQYGETYARDFDGLVATAVEQKFAFPFWRNDKVTIFLAGTIDLIGTYHGIPIIADHKTTASYVVKNYFEPYELGIQPMFYSWVWNHLNNEGDKFRSVLINGIFIKKPTQKATSNGQFDGVKFERSKPLDYSVEQMKMFETWFNNKLGHIKSIFNYEDISLMSVEEEFETDFDLAFCKTPFGLCKFFNVCKAPPSTQKLILNHNFVETKYNPLAFGGN